MIAVKLNWWQSRKLRKEFSKTRCFNVEVKNKTETEMLRKQLKVAVEALKAMRDGCDMMEYNRRTYTLPRGALVAIEEIECSYTGNSKYKRVLERLKEC